MVSHTLVHNEVLNGDLRKKQKKIPNHHDGSRNIHLSQNVVLISAQTGLTPPVLGGAKSVCTDIRTTPYLE